MFLPSYYILSPSIYLSQVIGIFYPLSLCLARSMVSVYLDIIIVLDNCLPGGLCVLLSFC